MVLGAALLVLNSPTSASATHGSWTRHHLVFGEQGTSQYFAYADVAASNATDYSHARVQVRRGTSFIRDEQVTCSGSCGYRRTPIVYWPQYSSRASSMACAVAGAHKLSGAPELYQACSPRGLEVHRHAVDLA